jgi:Protein of unknown function (DUF4035)
MGRTVRELLSSLDSEEIAEWAAFYRLDPFGGIRGDYQAAVVAQVVAQANAKKDHTFKLSDFLLKWGTKEQKDRGMSQQEILSMIRARFPRHG